MAGFIVYVMAKFACFGQLVWGTPFEASVQHSHSIMYKHSFGTLFICIFHARGSGDENGHVHAFVSLYRDCLVVQ